MFNTRVLLVKPKLKSSGGFLKHPVPISPFFRNLQTPKSMISVEQYKQNMRKVVNTLSSSTFDQSLYSSSDLTLTEKDSNYCLNKELLEYVDKVCEIDLKNEALIKETKESIKRLLSIDTGNSKNVYQKNVKSCIEKFGKGHNDTGSPEVQASIWTLKCRMMEKHLEIHRKDSNSRGRYQQLLHKRAKILKYLKRVSLDRYYKCLKELGLTTEMVEGSIPLKQYHR